MTSWTWNNVLTTPNRWMAYWLRRQGWVCFYLEERARHCTFGQFTKQDTCWLSLYQQSEKGRRQ